MSRTVPLPVRARALLGAAHAGPTAAVTVFALAWGALGAGLPARTLALLGAAVLAGQLTIGWTNDWADAGRDTAAGRTDKPVAVGLVSRRTVGTAASAAALACVGLSLALGPAAGAVHLVAVASGLLYDLVLKSTVASPLPYVVSFGLLPAVATLAAPEPAWPPLAVLVAAALLGVAAHLANTVADAEDDAATGVRGLPQRLGPRASALGAGLVVAFAAGTLLPAALSGETLSAGAPPSGGEGADLPAAVPVVLLAAGVLLGLAAAARVLRAGSGRAVGRGAFWLVVAAAGVVVLGFLTS